MFLKYLLSPVLFSPLLFCAALESYYPVYSTEFNASMIDPGVNEDFTLFTFRDNRHKKSFNSDKLLELFSKKGIALEDKSRGIVHVEHLSSIDLEPIKEEIENYYKKHFSTIKIENIHLKNNGYIDALPQDYALHFKPNAYLYDRSSIKIDSASSKQRHFVSYRVEAKIKLFKARNNINRGKILTPIDLVYQDEAFTRLKGLPVVRLDRGESRLKKRIGKGKVLYQHDIEILPAVLKGKPVNVRLLDGQVHLEFQAICLQDAYIGDSIFIKRSDGKRLKAKVISRNLVEIE